MRTAVIGRFFNISRNLWREPETELKLYYVPNGGEFPDGKIQEYGELREYSCDFKNDGSFEFAVTAESEGEYSFCISIVKDGVTMLDLANFSCYALGSDYRVYPGEEYHVPKIGWRFFIRQSIHIQRFISLH